jgi:hypothetical protein
MSYQIAKQKGGAYGVYFGRVAADCLISGHYTKAEAAAAIKRYEAADKRRKRATVGVQLEGITLARMGHFYEAFNQSACTVSRVLGLTLTKTRDGQPMCGFPAHRADECIAELEAAGYMLTII